MPDELSDKGRDGVTTITAAQGRPSLAHPLSPDRAGAALEVPLGIPAALLVSGWMFAFERRVDRPYLWALTLVTLAFFMLARPIARRGLLRRVALASLQLATLALVAFSVDRALAAWEARGPRFGAASAMASAALNLAGYHTMADRGLLLIDHPDGLVTILPSMEKLALRPLLLFSIAWSVLRLVRNHRPAFGASAVGLASTLLVGMVRYVAILAAYLEHDDILAGSAGQAALDLFTSPWITGVFLLIAGLAADHACQWLFDGIAMAVPPRPRFGKVIVAGPIVATLGGAAGLAWSFVPPGAEKAGRILIDDRFCGIWEP